MLDPEDRLTNREMDILRRIQSGVKHEREFNRMASDLLYEALSNLEDRGFITRQGKQLALTNRGNDRLFTNYRRYRKVCADMLRA